MTDWEVIPGFPNYSVNTQGEIRRETTGRILKQNANESGTAYVGLMRGSMQHHRSVALLVASTFIPRPAPAFDTPINLNGDRFDNRVDNLVWRPRWFAVKYNQQLAMGRPKIDKPIRDLESYTLYANSLECCMALGLLETDLELSILNRTYVWPIYREFSVVE